jgi:hypothetical protein
MVAFSALSLAPDLDVIAAFATRSAPEERMDKPRRNGLEGEPDGSQEAMPRPCRDRIACGVAAARFELAPPEVI